MEEWRAAPDPRWRESRFLRRGAAPRAQATSPQENRKAGRKVKSLWAAVSGWKLVSKGLEEGTVRRNAARRSSGSCPAILGGGSFLFQMFQST